MIGKKGRGGGEGETWKTEKKRGEETRDGMKNAGASGPDKKGRMWVTV